MLSLPAQTSGSSSSSRLVRNKRLRKGRQAVRILLPPLQRSSTGRCRRRAALVHRRLRPCLRRLPALSQHMGDLQRQQQQQPTTVPLLLLRRRIGRQGRRALRLPAPTAMRSLRLRLALPTRALDQPSPLFRRRSRRQRPVLRPPLLCRPLPPALLPLCPRVMPMRTRGSGPPHRALRLSPCRTALRAFRPVRRSREGERCPLSRCCRPSWHCPARVFALLCQTARHGRRLSC